jgi:hypothetical protein
VGSFLSRCSGLKHFRDGLKLISHIIRSRLKRVEVSFLEYTLPRIVTYLHI